MLRDIESIVEKISGTSNVAQLNKLSTLVNGGEKFKRKSNEEQFKYNSSVSLKLEEAEQSLEAHKLQKGRDKVAEGIGLKDNLKQLLGEVGVCENSKDSISTNLTSPHLSLNRLVVGASVMTQQLVCSTPLGLELPSATQQSSGLSTP